MFTMLVALTVAAPVDPPKEKALPEAAQKELQKLQGKWKAVKLATAGKEVTLGKDDPELIGEFKGRKWFFTGVEKAEVTAIDPASNPKCIDMKSLEEARNGAVDEAIYKLEGETLTIALYQGEGKNRPTGFEAPKERGTILVVLERVKEKPKQDKKPQEPVRFAAPAAEDKELPEAAQKELKKLEGKWKVVKLMVEGREEEPPPDAADNPPEIKGRKFLLGEKELFNIAALDPSTTPKLLDFKALNDMGEIQKGNTYEGIYKLDGDDLTIALYIGEGQKRPEKFEAPKDSKVVVVTFKREKK